MRETRSSGSVEGVMSNRDPYSDLLTCPFTGFDACHIAEVRITRINFDRKSRNYTPYKNERRQDKCGDFIALPRQQLAREVSRKEIALLIRGAFRQRFRIVGRDVAALQERIHGYS